MAATYTHRPDKWDQFQRNEAIRAEAAAGTPHRVLAEKYGISRGRVSKLCDPKFAKQQRTSNAQFVRDEAFLKRAR